MSRNDSKASSKKKQKQGEGSDVSEEHDGSQSHEENHKDGSHSMPEEDGNGEHEDWKALIDEYGTKPNKTMLAWADVLEDNDKLKEIGEKIWKEHSKGADEIEDGAEAKKAVKAFNEELLKMAREKDPDAEDQDIDKFPLSTKSAYDDWQEFKGQIELIGIQSCAKELRFLGSKLWSGVEKVYEKKYKDMKVESNDVEETYEKFFEDLGLEVKDEYYDMLMENYSDKANEAKTFDMKGVVNSIRGALKDFYYGEKNCVYYSKMLAPYKLN